MGMQVLILIRLAWHSTLRNNPMQDRLNVNGDTVAVYANTRILGPTFYILKITLLSIISII